MSKIKLLILSITLLMNSFSLFGAKEFQVRHTAIRSGVDQLNFSLNNFEIKTTIQDGKTYSVITGAGDVLTSEKGYAAIPFLNATLQISNDKNVSVLPEGSYEEISLEYPLLPSRGTLYRNQDPSTIPFTIDQASVTDSWYPGKVAENADPFIFRDIRGTNIYVYPFQYNAQKQVLRVYRNLKVTVAENNTTPTNQLRKVSTKLDKTMDDIYNSLFINYDKSRFANQVAEFGEMLVLYTSRDATAILPYINWKREKGFKVTATQVSTGALVTTTIKNAYTANSNLLYVQLVGDWADIKSPTVSVTTSADPTDPMMGCVVGTDLYPELIIGRFSCSTTAQLTVQINKAIEYEKNPDTNSSTNGWYKKALGIGSGEGSGTGDDGEADYVHMGIIKNSKLIPAPLSYSTVAEAYQTAGVTAASTPINAGLSLINYCGHGASNQWVTTGYSNTNVNASTNGSKLPFIFSVACVNGAFHESSDCFAETWLKKSDGGAVAVLMATINQPWVPPMRGQDYFNDILRGGYTYSGSQSGTSTTITDQRTTFGSIALNGNVLMLAQAVTDASTIETIQTWTIFGDASLQVRTDIPKTLAISPQPVVPSTPYSLTVNSGSPATPVKNALVSLYQNGNTYSAFTNASGVASVNHSISSGTAKLTVTAYNTTTYQGDVLVGGGYPIVSITAPANNSAHITGSTVNVTADASDPTKTVSKVEFFIDNISKVVDTSSPYSYSWNTTGYTNGVHTIKAVVTDNSNNSTNNEISVTLTDGLPTITITEPANNSTVMSNSNVLIAALATDPAKSVSKVDFFVDNVLKGTDTSSPYEYIWNTTGYTIAAHTIKAVVTDNLNNTSQQIISVTVISSLPALILNLDVTNSSSASMKTVIDALTASNTPVVTTLPADLSVYKRIFVCLGVYGTGYTALTAAIGTTLKTFVDAGKGVYLEGGDTWSYDTPTVVHPYFGITKGTDGSTWSGAALSQTGEDALAGINFTYAGDNSWMDVITVTAGVGTQVMKNSTQPTVVANKLKGCVGSVFEFAGVPAASQNTYMQKLLTLTVPSSSEVDEGNVLPVHTTLHQNYPNPFNPSTTLNFDLAKAGIVNLSVYNSKGEIVKELINRQLEPRSYSINFDGTGLNSGVYFYKLETGSSTMINKMILVK